MSTTATATPVAHPAPTATRTPASMTAQTFLLACGIVSSLLYVATDLIGASRWEGYSLTAQTISELAAIDAPSRSFVSPLFLAYGPIFIAFGVGVWRAAGRRRALAGSGACMIAMGVAGLPGIFFPIHMRGVEATFTDVMHVVITSVLVVFILAFIALGSAAHGRWFRMYSVATFLALVAGGAYVGLVETPRLTAGMATPWLGVAERVMVHGYLLWVVVLAVILLRVGPRARDAG